MIARIWRSRTSVLASAGALLLAGCAGAPGPSAPVGGSGIRPVAAPVVASVRPAQPMRVTLTVIEPGGATLHSAQLTAYAGRPAPGTDLVEHSYVETASRDPRTQAVIAKPGTFTTGFSYALTPTMVGGRDVLLSLHLVVVDLIEMQTMQWAGLPVQLPITSTAAIDATRLFLDGRGEATIALPRRRLAPGQLSPMRAVRVSVAPVDRPDLLTRTADRGDDTLPQPAD